MAYHVGILKFDGSDEDFQSVPAHWQPPSLGDAPEVRARISQVWPDVDWSDPEWGRTIHAGCSLEFQMPGGDCVDSFRINIRGGGDPLASITELCKRFGWAAVEGSSGSLLDLDAPSREGLHGWQAYSMGTERRRSDDAQDPSETDPDT